MKDQELLNRLKLISENSEALTTLYRANGIPEYVSPRSIDILGYKPEEVMEKPSYFGILDEYKREYFDYVSEIKKGNTREQGFEFKYQKKQGDIIWLKTTMKPVYDEQGVVVRIQASTTDITKSKIYSARLKEAEQNANAIINSSNSSILLISSEYKILVTNDRAKVLSLKLFNETVTKGADLRKFLKGNTKTTFLEGFEKALKGETSKSYRKIIFANNKEHWFHVKYTPIWNNDGSISSVSWQATDVTDEKRAEEYTLNVLQRLSLANSAGGIGIWEYDFNSKRVRFDDQCLNLFDKKLDVHVSLPKWATVYDFKSKSRLLTALDASVSEEKSRFEITLELNEPMGKVLFQKLKGSIQFKDKKPVSAVGVLLDLTETKNKEIELLASQKQLNNAQQLTNMGGFEFELRNKRITWSENNFNIHQIKNREIPTLLTYLRLIEKKDRSLFIETLRKAIHSDKAQQCVIKANINGALHTLNYRIKSEFYRNKLNKIVGTIQDITHNISLQKTLEQKTAELDKNQERLSQYSFVNSHKVRSPLSNVLGIIQLLRIEYTDELLEMLEKSADELDKVIHEVNSLLAE